jgi:hypothetical protein
MLDTSMIFSPATEELFDRFQAAGGNPQALTSVVLDDPIYDRRGSIAGYSGGATMLQNPKVAVKYALAWGIPTSKSAHRQRAQYFRDLENVLEREYQHSINMSLNTFGRQGPLVSGIIRDHFPPEVKLRLRFLAHAIPKVNDAARCHEYLAKSRSPLFK